MNAKKHSSRGIPPQSSPARAKGSAPQEGNALAHAATWKPHLWQLGLILLGGVLYFSGFAGFDLWPLAFVALIPLFFVLEQSNLKQALLLGALYGWVTNWGGYYWLVEMLQKFSGFGTLLCVLFTAIICLYQGGQFAFFAGLYRAARTRGWSPWWVAPLAYGVSEMAYPLLFPSYYANSLHDQLHWIQIADVGGPMLISALIVLVNVAFYQSARLFMRRSRPSRREWAPILMSALFVLATLAYGHYRLLEVRARSAAAPSLKVGIVQTNMGIFSKREDPGEGLRRHLEQSIKLEQEVKPDLLIWPESAYTFVVPENVPSLRPWVTGPLKTPLLFGGLSRRYEGGKERLYNTAFLLDREGRALGRYDKTYLLAFGEYLPFGETFPILYEWSPNSGHFTPGNHTRPLKLGPWRLSTLVCYEDILPAFVRGAVRSANPHLLVNVTNDAWFGKTTEPWIHLALAKFRAVEHHRYLVRATNSGVSAVVDATGQVVRASGVFTRENLDASVALLQGHTLYEYLGDWPGWLSLLGMAFLLWRRKATPA